MGRVTEKLNNGVMTGPDPAVLESGTLSFLRNATYLPNSLALVRARGRIVWGTATSSASDVCGLRDFQFDNGDHYLLAQVSSQTMAYYSTAAVEGVGTFGVLTAVTATTTLETIHYQNRFYALNGASAVITGFNSNRVIYLSSTALSTPPTLRQHGMIPVNALPSGAITASAAIASTFAASASGYYEYWTTEVLQYTQDGITGEIESAFGGDKPLTVYVSSTGVSPLLIMPALANVSATHWRIYRSPAKTYITDRNYPDGFVIATQSTASAQFVDTLQSTQTTFATPSGVYAVAGWSSATAMTAQDTTYASATAFPNGVNYVYLDCPNFGFKGSILGIEVSLRAYIRSGTQGFANIIVARKANVPQGFSIPYGYRSIVITGTNSASPQSVTAGSTTDPWLANPNFPGFVDTDFVPTNLMIGITQASLNMAVDVMQVRVSYGGGQNDGAIIPYPTVVYTFGDTTVEVAKNGPPPNANTGDIYDDALVTNSTDEPRLIRYSYPNMTDAFPATYYLGFNTKENDVVKLVKRCNNTLIVGLLNSIWRVNYLPSERDASFDRGLATEPISKQYGVVSPMCACLFSDDMGPERLAFVSQKGIHVTDGYHLHTQTDGQNWDLIATRAAGQTYTPIALINDPEHKEILFYYRNTELGVEQYGCLHLSYAGLHKDDDQLKVSGPVNMRNWDAVTSARAGLKSAWTVPRLNGDTTLFLGYGADNTSATAAGAGMVYYETGTTIPAQDNVMRFRTRRMFLAGEGNEFRLNEAYAYGTFATAGGNPAIDMATQTVKTNDDTGEVTQTAKTTTFAGRKMGKWQFRQMVEGLILSGAVTGNPNNDISIEHLILDGENFGTEDSGD